MRLASGICHIQPFGIASALVTSAGFGPGCGMWNGIALSSNNHSENDRHGIR